MTLVAALTAVRAAVVICATRLPEEAYSVVPLEAIEPALPEIVIDELVPPFDSVAELVEQPIRSFV